MFSFLVAFSLVQLTFADDPAPTPAAPEKTATPATPEKAATPATPEKAATPETPATPAKAPEKAATPEKTATPATPEKAATPETPATPAKAPEKAATPEKTATPETPAEAAKTTEAPSIEDIIIEPVILWHTNSSFCTKSLYDVVVSAEKGHPEACYELALRILAENPKKKDIKQAISYIEEAASNGYAEAQLWVAEHYENGKKYPKNFRQAYLWGRKAAEQQQPRAQYFLSLLYSAGRGVEPDSVQSAFWAYKSADNKYPPAMTRIGTLFLQGLGVPQNERSAVQWFLRAAMYNDSTAQYYLGICYDRGEGVNANVIEAYKWLNISASQGNAQAMNARQKIVKKMNETQILEGQSLSGQLNDVIHSQTSLVDVDPLAINLPVEETASGFFITDDGYILTSWHPLENALGIYARTVSGFFKADIVLKDIHNDLALLKIDNHIASILTSTSVLAKDQPTPIIGTAIKPLALAPAATFSLGDPVFTVGFPKYDRLVYSPCLCEGNLKDVTSQQGDPRYLRIGILTSQKYTGAPIITAAGEVIGIMNITANEKSEQDYYHNAIRVQYVTPIFDSLPEVKAKLKAPPTTKEQKFSESVAQATESVVQIIVY